MKKNFHIFWLILCMITLSGITVKILAQPGETAPMAGNGYVVMKTGDTLNGRINWRMKYADNNPAEIKFIPENGSPQILNAGDISGLSIDPQTDFEGNELPRADYVSMPSMKKGIPVFYNRLLNGKLQVYQNRSSVIIKKETAEVSTEFDGIEFRYSKETGLTVGPTYKTSYRIIESRTRYSSYFILKDQGELQKIDKDNYDSVFSVLFSDCPGIQKELEKNPGLRKFKNFMILVEVYNQLCR
jgi:hypothetical protein